MTTNNSRLMKKMATIGVNALVGGLIAGGAGALVGVISSVDSGFIGAAIDKITTAKDIDETDTEEVATDVEDAPA